MKSKLHALRSTLHALRSTLILLLSTLCLCASVVNSSAQTILEDTNPPTWGKPAQQALDFLRAGSNWMVAAYGISNDKFDKFGGGIAAAYLVNPYLAPCLRLDYYDGKVWMPSASAQLQIPIQLNSNLALVPFALSGIATPIAGKGSDNGTAVGIFGAGIALRIGKHFDLLADYEKWSGFEGNQFRFGALYKF